jgi:outer membrane receptor for ferrienterochelin and colicins
MRSVGMKSCLLRSGVLFLLGLSTTATAAESEPPAAGADQASPVPSAPAAESEPPAADQASASPSVTVAEPPPPATAAIQESSSQRASSEPSPVAVAPSQVPVADSFQADFDQLSLNDLLNVKVTVASRTMESVEDAPASLTVFTREQIQRMAVSTLEDLLNYVPGFQVGNDAVFGRLGRISVRGLFSTVSSGVLLLRDGVPEWNPYDGSAWNFARHVMLNDVERVEVMRGPGSTMWGTNASSAVINIVSVKNRDTVAAGYGSIGRRELSANFHSEVVSGLKLSGSVQGYADEGFTFKNYTDTFGVTGNIKDPLSQYTATIRGEYKGLTLTVRSSGTWWREFVEWAAASRVNRNTIDRYNADLAYRLNLGKTGNVTFGMTYSNDKLDTYGLSVPRGIPLIPGQPLARDWYGGPFVTVPVVRLRTDVTWNPFAGNTFNAGFAGAYGWMARAGHFADHDVATLAELGSSQILDGNMNFVDQDAWQTLLGLYAQDSHHFGPLALVAGARMDYTLMSSQLPGPFERHRSWYLPVLPRAALSYKTPIASTVKLMYGRAFRAPSISELTIAHNPVITGGLAIQNYLRPEIVDTGELAYTQNLFSKVSITGTSYVSYSHDLITPGQALSPADPCFPVCNPGSTALGNNSRLLTTGLEFELKASPVNGLLLVGSYSHLFGAWRNGDRADVEQSTNAFSADVGYSIANVTFDVSGFYRQHVALVPKQDGYLILNSRVSYKFLQRLKVSASAENILNEQFFGLTSYNLPNGSPARGRTFHVSLGYE